MERSKLVALLGLIGGSILLSTQVLPNTSVFDKPYHSAIVLFAILATTLSLLHRFLPGEHRNEDSRSYSPIPLEDLHDRSLTRSSHRDYEAQPSTIGSRQKHILIILLVATICLRVECARITTTNAQCASASWEPFIPFIFALWDWWTVQRLQSFSPTQDLDGSVYDGLAETLQHPLLRYTFPTLLIGLGSSVALSISRSPDSTQVCPGHSFHAWTIPLATWLSTLLDIFILYTITQLFSRSEGRMGSASRYAPITLSFGVSSLILSLFGGLYYFFAPFDRTWVSDISRPQIWSILEAATLLAVVFVCAIFMTTQIDLVTTLTLVAFSFVVSLTTSRIWTSPHSFPPGFEGWGLIALFVISSAFVNYLGNVSSFGSKTGRGIIKSVRSWLYLSLAILFFSRFFLWLSRRSTVTFHPIDMLLWQAQHSHEAYLKQSLSSTTLQEAVETYRRRYEKLPPPGFDHWYKFATERDSLVIDDFDSIDRDLLPFRAIAPAEIRRRSWQIISNSWNDTGCISIRDGNVVISSNIKLTHRWMVDGLADMIRNFAQWLPDMDLPINLNDEPRVTVPHHDMELMQRNVEHLSLIEKPRNEFTVGRAEQWTLAQKDSGSDVKLRDESFTPIFHSYGSVGCPPGTRARKQRRWRKDALCTECADPHSLGAFLSNWTLSADVCHQPDLVNLHGFFVSPATFRGAQQLYPIFSQSKINGFHDILYPSAWNYADKAKYEPTDANPDPTYAEKENTILWRGATTEGVSTGAGQWKSMVRQRFAHMAAVGPDRSPHVTSPSTAASQVLLLPRRPSAGDKRDRYAYALFRPDQLTSLLSTDIRVVGPIQRCLGLDCSAQWTDLLDRPWTNVPAEVAAVTASRAIDFQRHWHYRYLLDLDGAGMSGRFLPFLQSRSLPFKAGLFREWWDGRVTAWQHFVPLDIRGHGFWATLAYFAGVNGTVDGREIRVPAHELEGERIAENGRKWAEKVLRKEDMEIYLFRLLLEWGRMTDDDRDFIGFVPSGDV